MGFLTSGRKYHATNTVRTCGYPVHILARTRPVSILSSPVRVWFGQEPYKNNTKNEEQAETKIIWKKDRHGSIFHHPCTR